MRKNLKVVTIMEQNQTSWENFFRNDSSNMLEDALPYLPPNLKKVAAIYIKLTELSKISSDIIKNSLKIYSLHLIPSFLLSPAFIADYTTNIKKGILANFLTLYNSQNTINCK